MTGSTVYVNHLLDGQVGVLTSGATVVYRYAESVCRTKEKETIHPSRESERLSLIFEMNLD